MDLVPNIHVWIKSNYVIRTTENRQSALGYSRATEDEKLLLIFHVAEHKTKISNSNYSLYNEIQIQW